MPVYAYPIQIKKEKQIIYFDEKVRIEKNLLTRQDLEFIGIDSFSICEGGEEECYEGYTILVKRKRFETNEERDIRVRGEEQYMAEYKKRLSIKSQSK